MKTRFAFLMFAACLAAASARAEGDTVTNLNPTSNLKDEGIDPNPAPPATILDGVPLMEGLQPAPDPGFDILPDFGKTPPTVTVGVVDVDDVYNFYKTAMPQAGWQSLGARDYRRGTVNLHINAQANGKISTVTFTEIPDAK